jgi:hypothetical protein
VCVQVKQTIFIVRSAAWVVVKCKKIFTAHKPWTTKYEDNHPHAEIGCNGDGSVGDAGERDDTVFCFPGEFKKCV